MRIILRKHANRIAFSPHHEYVREAVKRPAWRRKHLLHANFTKLPRLRDGHLQMRVKTRHDMMFGIPDQVGITKAVVKG